MCRSRRHPLYIFLVLAACGAWIYKNRQPLEVRDYVQRRPRKSHEAAWRRARVTCGVVFFCC